MTVPVVLSVPPRPLEAAHDKKQVAMDCPVHHIERRRKRDVFFDFFRRKHHVDVHSAALVKAKTVTKPPVEVPVSIAHEERTTVSGKRVPFHKQAHIRRREEWRTGVLDTFAINCIPEEHELLVYPEARTPFVHEEALKELEERHAIQRNLCHFRMR